MKLTQLIFRDYKAFGNEENLEIRPLTVLIGPNSSGKSAIARLPLLLSRGLSSQAEAPLDLEFGGVDFAGSFKELVHNQSARLNITLGMEFLDKSDEKWTFRTRVQGYDEYQLQLVERLELSRGDSPVFMARWNGKDPVNEANKYLVDCPSGEEQQVEFKGLLPSPSSVPLESVQSLRNSLKVSYLGPFRETPERMYRFPGGRSSNVGPGGKQAPHMLAGDSTQNGRQILDEVGVWFSKHLGGRRLDVETGKMGFSLVLLDPKHPSLRVNLVDVGTGIAQVLPMVVQRMFDAAHGTSDTLEVVEQPELHLHPQAHGDLADLYVTACAKAGARFLIETHSELFLLRIRRRIAEGTLNPDDVIFHWVRGDDYGENKITPIHIDREGEVSTWPTDVFSDAYKEIVAIRRAGKKEHSREEDGNEG